MGHTSGTVYTVALFVGFQVDAEEDGHTIYVSRTSGAEASWFLTKLDEDIEEADLISGLEEAGVPRDRVIDALQQCGF